MMGGSVLNIVARAPTSWALDYNIIGNPSGITSYYSVNGTPLNFTPNKIVNLPFANSNTPFAQFSSVSSDFSELNSQAKILATLGAASSLTIVYSSTSMVGYTTGNQSVYNVYYASGTLLDYYNNSNKTTQWSLAFYSWQPVLRVLYCPPSGDDSVFGPGVFAALCEGGTLYISTDDTGSNFRQNYDLPHDTMLDMAYRDGVLCVISATNIYVTADGQNWITLPSMAVSPQLLANIL